MFEPPCECTEEDAYSEVLASRAKLDAAAAELVEAKRAYDAATEAHLDAMEHWVGLS